MRKQQHEQKGAQHFCSPVHAACAFPQFYGNANENTKRLFRDRLKARATPTLAMFDADGEMRHSHSGANKSRLEFYLREFIGETSSETIYPPYQLTGM